MCDHLISAAKHRDHVTANQLKQKILNILTNKHGAWGTMSQRYRLTADLRLRSCFCAKIVANLLQKNEGINHEFYLFIYFIAFGKRRNISLTHHT